MFWRRKQKVTAKHRTARRLGVEQLEPRAMNSVGGLQESLPAPNVSSFLGRTQLTATTASPSIVSRILIDGGSVARGTSAAISVKGTDDGGEAFIKYSWSFTQIPLGAQIRFGANHTNAAKNSRVYFDRAGDYTIRVTLTDEDGRSTASSLTFTVAQTITRLELRTFDDQLVNANTPILVSRTNHRLHVRGLDQFGNTIAKLPAVSWLTRSAPSGAGLTTDLRENVATQAFTRVGLYQIRAASGTAVFDYSVQVLPTPSSLHVTTPTGNVVVNGSRMSATTNSQRFKLVARDQFGQRLFNQPSSDWAVITRPTTAVATMVRSGDDAVLSVDRAGVYSLQTTVGNLVFSVSVNFVPTLKTLRFLSNNGTTIGPTDVQTTNGTSILIPLQGYDQFDALIQNLPGLNWLALTSPVGGKISTSISAGLPTISFNSSGAYSIRASAGGVTASLAVQVNQTLTSVAVTNSLNQAVRHGTASTINRISETLTASGRDQFGAVMQTQPSFNWTLLSVPKDSLTAISAPSTSTANLSFDRTGVYSLRLTVPTMPVFETRIAVDQVLSGLAFAPNSIVINVGSARQMTVEGRDQFSQVMGVTTPLAWSATGGTILNSGLFTAGNSAGNFNVTARAGNWTASLAVQVISGNPGAIFTDPSIESAITAAYTDNSISRVEMISLLRSVGADGTLSNAELTDLRTLTSSTSYVMPNHVRALARNVVFYNVANAIYQGLAAGNLADGSSATLLNNLIDKWFLGSDLPAISGTGVAYNTVLGPLFSGNPTSEQATPGAGSNSYFFASLGSIADRNANAIRNMFLDNGDGTFTVRFYGGTLGTSLANNGRITNGFAGGIGKPEYVTVNREVPVTTSDILVYAGAGRNRGSSLPVWAVLAEKAYAQWSETGNAGRAGLNSYAALAGGWMSTSNAHILGYNSINYSFSTAIADNLIAAMSVRQAVTLSTRPGASGGGLLGSQTYSVVAYNSLTKTFTLKSTSGTSHPSPVTWAQLQANGLHFSVVGPIVWKAFDSSN